MRWGVGVTGHTVGWKITQFEPDVKQLFCTGSPSVLGVRIDGTSVQFTVGPRRALRCARGRCNRRSFNGAYPSSLPPIRPLHLRHICQSCYNQPMKSRVTIRDVAREAGVSHQTVSRVINNSPKISATTRHRVESAITKLNFRPSRTARNLATQRTMSVGLLVPNIANPYFAEVAHGAQEVARAANYSVFLGNTEWDPQEELQLLQTLAAYPVDGIIVNSARLVDKELRAFCDTFRPVVLGGRIFAHPNTSMVRSAHSSGMRLVVAHLQKQGHTHIAMLAGPDVPPTMSNALRLNAFRQALVEADLPRDEAWIFHGPLTMEGGYQSALRLLTTVPEITAICAHNDLVAIGAMKACRELGRRIPADCAVLGYNDNDLAAMVEPALTTVRVDTFEMGRQLMQRLLAMIEQPTAEFPELLLPVTELIVRESG